MSRFTLYTIQEGTIPGNPKGSADQSAKFATTMCVIECGMGPGARDDLLLQRDYVRNDDLNDLNNSATSNTLDGTTNNEPRNRLCGSRERGANLRGY
jgi:hypothetical protein